MPNADARAAIASLWRATQIGLVALATPLTDEQRRKASDAMLEELVKSTIMQAAVLKWLREPTPDPISSASCAEPQAISPADVPATEEEPGRGLHTPAGRFSEGE